MASTPHDDGLALCGVDAAGVGVEDEVGVDEVGVIFEEPVDAVGFAAFFVGGEGEDEVAVGDEAFALQADEGGDDDGVVVLHVLGAAAVEVAVLLDEAGRGRWSSRRGWLRRRRGGR